MKGDKGDNGENGVGIKGSAGAPGAPGEVTFSSGLFSEGVCRCGRRLPEHIRKKSVLVNSKTVISTLPALARKSTVIIKLSAVD